MKWKNAPMLMRNLSWSNTKKQKVLQRSGDSHWAETWFFLLCAEGFGTGTHHHFRWQASYHWFQIWTRHICRSEHNLRWCYITLNIRNLHALYDIKEFLWLSLAKKENVSTWTIRLRTESLGRGRTEAKAQMAYDGDGEYLPENGTFCKVSVKCRARAEEKWSWQDWNLKMPLRQMRDWRSTGCFARSDQVGK